MKLAPEPGVAEIASLVSDFARAGLNVTLQTEGPVNRVTAAVGLALYRITQESLANIAKHAPDAKSTVMLTISRASARLTIVNQLPVTVAVSAPASEGRGLRGMRQRVELLGGSIEVGPSDDGWSVGADIPLGDADGRRTPVVLPIMTGDAAEIAVLLVDDQDLVRSGLRRILRRKDGFVIVAECSDGDEVPDAVARHRPDVVVMDLRMRRVDGIEATRLLSADGGPPVLALTTFNDDELLSGVLRAGASGFVLKDSSAEELIRAVRAVAGGDSYPRPGGHRASSDHLPQGRRATA